MRHQRDVAGRHTSGRWSEVQGRGVLRLLRGALGLGAVVVTVAGCGSSSSSSTAAGSASKGGAQTTIRVAVVSNPNMINIEKLTPEFEKLNPGIKVVYDTLNENNERSLIETDITTHANQFNAVMISNYETPIWAHNGWLVNLSPQLGANPSYDVNDLLKPIASSLTCNGGLYGVPFYGESSMV
jgi:sorbitol/mannitol transport system substrate-binding protein